MLYLEVLKALHDRLSPTTYLEIGVSRGASLALARCRAVAIDPAFSVTEELDGDVCLIRSTSDDFFATQQLADHTRGLPVDLAFIDGMHLFEFALRDFINVERHATDRSVIVLDDMLPRDADEAARARHTQDWTGDVFRLTGVLRRYRPELIVLPLDAEPTGMLLVAGLDPESTSPRRQLRRHPRGVSPARPAVGAARGARSHRRRSGPPRARVRPRRGTGRPHERRVGLA